MKTLILLFLALNTYSADKTVNQGLGKDYSHVHVIATGGTIAGQGEDDTNYTEGKVDISDILKSVPGVNDIGPIEAEQFLSIGSQSIRDKHWFLLAQRISQIQEEEDVKAIVITHGTDTMVNTAFFLDMVVASKKPIILVGAMKPASAEIPDGPGNLKMGLRFGFTCEKPGFYISMGTNVMPAGKVRKTHTTSVLSFQLCDESKKSLVQAPMFPQLLRNSDFTKSVQIISRQNEGSTPIIDAVMRFSNIGGLVYNGVGNGCINEDDEVGDMEALRNASRAGVIVVRTSSVFDGPVTPALDDPENGFVASLYLRASDSVTLLKMCLDSGICERSKIQEVFQTVSDKKYY